MAISVRPWVDAVRPHIGKLIAASSFLPPTAAAETINKMLSEEQFNDLVDDIEDTDGGGFAGRLSGYFPDDIGGADPEWIGAVLQVLLTDYVEPEPPTGTGAA